MRICCAVVLMLWAWQGFSASELTFEGEEVSIDHCGETETLTPMLVLATGLAEKWKEHTPQEERFSHILAYVLVQEGAFPYPLGMLLRDGDVYFRTLYDDDGNKQTEYEKVGRVSKDDASNLQLAADLDALSVQISITGIDSDKTSATVVSELTKSADCVVTWESKLKLKSKKAL